MKQNILITGANGQLGQSLQYVFAKKQIEKFNIYSTDIDTLDITDCKALENYIINNQIDSIVNAAAYTAVEKAETEKEKAYLINEQAVVNLAAIAKKRNLFLIHISTDYVFDGTSRVPYTPEMPINPISVYGKSKAAGEKAILDQEIRSAILRTSWLYSPYGGNFVKTMVRLGQERDSLQVVNDQIGAPTYGADLADVIFAILGECNSFSGPEIYHYANEGVISWYDFAMEIMRLAQLDCQVSPISSAVYPAKVERPAYSVFDLTKIKKRFNLHIPTWAESLEKAMPEILSNTILLLSSKK